MQRIKKEHKKVVNELDTNNLVDTYVDTIGLKCDNFESKQDRDDVFNNLINFIKEQKLIGIKYDKERSTKYYQRTNLVFANSKLGSISKGYYEINQRNYKKELYFINIEQYGLKRHNPLKDDKSITLLSLIASYLNMYHVYYRIFKLDLAMDIPIAIDNIVVVPMRRVANTKYYPLGDINGDGSSIQENEGTYYIQKYSSNKKRNSTASRAYWYNKRYKELSKYKYEIGYELTRFEVKLQNGFFRKKDYQYIITTFRKALVKYNVLHFKYQQDKDNFIKAYNNATKRRQRKKVMHNVLRNNNVSLLEPRMDKVGNFLRRLDTVTLTINGKFKYTPHEEYLYSNSKLNY